MEGQSRTNRLDSVAVFPGILCRSRLGHRSGNLVLENVETTKAFVVCAGRLGEEHLVDIDFLSWGHDGPTKLRLFGNGLSRTTNPWGAFGLYLSILIRSNNEMYRPALVSGLCRAFLRLVGGCTSRLLRRISGFPKVIVSHGQLCSLARSTLLTCNNNN